MPTFKKSEDFFNKTREQKQKLNFAKKEDNNQETPEHSFIS